jgi:hypothetical protein
VGADLGRSGGRHAVRRLPLEPRPASPPRLVVATALSRRGLGRLEGEPPGEPHPRPLPSVNLFPIPLYQRTTTPPIIHYRIPLVYIIPLPVKIV